MKATDLRIGNLVYAPNKKDILQISRDMFSYERGLTNLEDLEPIELTEEWLLRMGFEKKYDDLFTKRLSTDEYYIFCYIDKNTGAEIGISINNQRSYFKKGKVHQLQNLYHALTVEELTIK